jgi:hypothetical protein
MNRDLEGVRGSLERTGVSIGKRPQEVAGWSSEVGKLTHNFGGAAEAMKGLAGLAAETGRSVDDYRGLAVELGTVGKVGGDTTHVIGMLDAQAKALGTAGGVAAFVGQVEGLGETISHFAIGSEADFLKVTAAAGALSKGFGDVAARRVQQAAFGALAADPNRWSRYLHRDVTNEYGQVENPSQVMQEVAEKAKRQFGKDAKRVLMLNFGAETGAALYKADWSKAAETAGLSPSNAPSGALHSLLNTDAGKRDVAGAQLDASSRDMMGSSTMLGRAADALQQWTATNPFTATLVSTALGSGASAFMSLLGKRMMATGVMGGKGGGSFLGAGGVAGKLGAFGMMAGSLAIAAEEIGSTGSEIYGGKGFMHGVSSFADDLMFAHHGRSAVAGDNRGYAAQAAQNARNLELAHARQGAEAGLGIFSQLGISANGMTPEALAKAFASAVKDGLKVEVTNASDTPVTATVKGGQSSSAGSQASG